jgi:hypothetical protein
MAMITKSNYTQIGDMLINADRFDNCSTPDPTPGSSCILWTGAKHRQGYGMMGYVEASTNKKCMNVVHRLVKIHELGRELTRDEYVVHSCSNPLCINTKHLILGDAITRNQVMYANGRGPKNRGKNKVRGILEKQNRTYKYSEEEINWVRNAPAAEIAAKYNLTHKRAGTMKGAFRGGYSWLPYTKINQPTGRKPKAKEQK